MRSSRPLAAVVFSFVVAAIAGCDLGVCTSDAQCPDDLPFCVLGSCADSPGGRGDEGEGDVVAGEGEGEVVGCSSDADCGDGLCFDPPSSSAHIDAALFTCVPPDAVDNCDAASLSTRQTGAPVIYNVVAQRTFDTGCPAGQSNVQLEVPYFDRDASGFGGEAAVFAIAGGTTNLLQTFGSVSENSGDPTGKIFAGFGDFCIDDGVTVIALAAGLTSPVTNTLCVDVTFGE